MSETVGYTVSQVWDRVKPYTSPEDPAGEYYDYYREVRNWALANYDNGPAYFANEDHTRLLALAMVYAMEGGTAAWAADAAIGACTYMLDYLASSESQRREQLTAMAFVYDWCYGRMSASQRQAIREDSGRWSLYNRIRLWTAPADNEYMWGYGGERISLVLLALAAVLNDSDDSNINQEFTNWTDSSFDYYYAGSNSQSFAAPFRYFGDTDGGTYKGAGSLGYLWRHEQYFATTYPAWYTGLSYDFWTNEPWWQKSIDWQIWHYRGDGGLFHNQNDGLRFARFMIHTHSHAIQVAQYDPTELGNRAMWLAREIEFWNDYAPYGPHHVYNCFWRENARNPSFVRPTVDGTGVATTGTNQMRVFSAAKKVVWRTGWSWNDTSMTLSGQRPTGGHSHRDAGHFEIFSHGGVLVTRHGHYDSGSTAYNSFYQVVGDPERTGHNWTYYKREIAHSTIRIFDTDEAAENQVDSLQAQMSTANSFFGRKYYPGTPEERDEISNTGGQLWEKDRDGSPYYYQPKDLAHFLAKSYWSYETFPVTPVETGDWCYAVVNMTSAYYSAKCSRARRHVLWLKPRVIDPDYADPIILIWDDINAHIDSAKGNRTTTYNLQVISRPTGQAQAFVVPTAAGKLYHKTLLPASPQWQIVEDFKDEDGFVYPPSKTTAYDDSLLGEVVRVELNPTTASTTPQFLNVLFPVAGSVQESDLPQIAVFEDDDFVGVTFSDFELRAKIAKGDTHYAALQDISGGLPPPTQPSPPTGLVATAGDEQASLDWANNGELDLDYYKVYRQEETAPDVWGAWAFVDTAPTSDYLDTGLANGTTYKYYVTAVNTSALESNPSVESNEVTPTSGPAPTPPPPVTPPAYDNRLASAGHHLCTCAPPIPSGDSSITTGDKLQSCWIYCAVEPGPPEIDYANSGTCMTNPTAGVVGGSCLTSPESGSADAAAIESAEPTTPAEAEEIDDDS